MTLYLTTDTTTEEVRKVRASGPIHAAKYHPAGGFADFTRIASSRPRMWTIS